MAKNIHSSSHDDGILTRISGKGKNTLAAGALIAGLSGAVLADDSNKAKEQTQDAVNSTLGLSQEEIDAGNRNALNFSYNAQDSVKNDNSGFTRKPIKSKGSDWSKTKNPNGLQGTLQPTMYTVADLSNPNMNQSGNIAMENMLAGNPAALSAVNAELQSRFGGLSGIEYSSQYGMIINVGVRINPDDSSSLVFLGKLGPKEQEVLAAYGIQIDKSKQIVFLGEELRQKRTFETEKEDYWVSQYKIGVAFRFMPSIGIFKSVDAKLDYKASADKELSNTIVIVDGDTLYEKYIQKNAFIGAKEINAIASGTMDIGENGELVVSGGATSISDNDGKNDRMTASGGLKYIHYTGDGKISVELRREGDYTQTGIGYEGAIPNSNITYNVGANHIEGPNGFSDNRGMFMLNFPLDGKSTKHARFNRPKQGTMLPIGLATEQIAKSSQSYAVI